jgi:hypothetical protein
LLTRVNAAERFTVRLFAGFHRSGLVRMGHN